MIILIITQELLSLLKFFAIFEFLGHFHFRVIFQKGVDDFEINCKTC